MSTDNTSDETEGPTTVSDSLEAGTTDRYDFTGRVESFESSGDVTVRVNRRERPDLAADHEFFIEATDSLADYQFRVDEGGQISPGTSIEDIDTVSDDGRTASGQVDVGWPGDSWYVEGELVSVSVSGNPDVYVDGEPIDPSTIGDGGSDEDSTGDSGQGESESGSDSDGSDSGSGDDSTSDGSDSEDDMTDDTEHELILSSSDGGADYDFRLSGGEVLEADDNVSDGRLQVTGTVWESYTDYVVFVGSPESLTGDDWLTAELDGETVDPEDIGDVLDAPDDGSTGDGGDGSGDEETGQYTQADLNAAREAGYDDGYAAGKAEGYDVGYADGTADGEAIGEVTGWNDALAAVREGLPAERSTDDSE
jgi:hypothetical protein